MIIFRDRSLSLLRHGETASKRFLSPNFLRLETRSRVVDVQYNSI